MKSVACSIGGGNLKGADMTTLFEIGVTNALLATVLAVVVWCITRFWRQPAIAQLLWVLVLVKLVTPPMVAIPWHIEFPFATAAQTAAGSTDPANAMRMNESAAAGSRDARSATNGV